MEKTHSKQYMEDFVNGLYKALKSVVKDSNHCLKKGEWSALPQKCEATLGPARTPK